MSDRANSPSELQKTIDVHADYWPFNGQPRARERYLAMRLEDDIDRAKRGRDPQCVWDAEGLWDALHVVARHVREFEEAAAEVGG